MPTCCQSQHCGNQNAPTCLIHHCAAHRAKVPNWLNALDGAAITSGRSERRGALEGAQDADLYLIQAPRKTEYIWYTSECKACGACNSLAAARVLFD